MDYRIEQLRYLLREDPSSRIFYQLGELLRREGEAAQAVEVLKTGLERHPRYVAAWVCLGRSQRDLHALEEAASAFRTALEIDRENPVAARLLGETAIEQKDWLGAVKALKLSRALSGADEGLDAEIAMVESHLDDDGRLEQRPFGRPRPAAPPVRCLEIVNLSADDPFSASAEESAARFEADDVFASAAPAAEVVADEVADEAVEEGEAPFAIDAAGDEATGPVSAGGVDVFAEPVADEPRGIETGTATGITADAPEGVGDDDEAVVAAEVERLDEPGASPVEEASIVDESSVGAWSTTMRAAGVAGDEAWTEPGDRIVADDAPSSDPAWAEPGAAADAVEAPADDTRDGVETVGGEEPPRPDEPIGTAVGLDDRGADAALEGGADGEGVETADDGVRAVDPHQFDSIEATHPLVVERQSADAEVQAFAAVDGQEAGEEADEDIEAARDDGALPGEDRGLDAIEVTRPIPVPDRAGSAPVPRRAATPARSAEVGDDGPADADAESTDKRHKLEHGVPLPTMTLARLALDQDDRQLAMATLESLIERNPGNTEAVAMLEELSAREATVANERLRAVRATSKIAALQGWLDAVRLAAERRVQ
jgi:hypothetical protein